MKKRILAVCFSIALIVGAVVLSEPITERRVYKDCGYDITKHPRQFNCTEKVQYRPGWMTAAMQGGEK